MLRLRYFTQQFRLLRLKILLLFDLVVHVETHYILKYLRKYLPARFIQYMWLLSLVRGIWIAVGDGVRDACTVFWNLGGSYQPIIWCGIRGIYRCSEIIRILVGCVAALYSTLIFSHVLSLIFWHACGKIISLGLFRRGARALDFFKCFLSDDLSIARKLLTLKK